MVQEISIDCQQRLESFFHAVETAQKLQDNILKYGLLTADLYYEDIDGNWLEKWGEEKQTIVEHLTAFLSSDDLVAVKLRDLLVDKSFGEIANELEKCLSLSTEEEKIFAVKTFLVDNFRINNHSRKLSHEMCGINLLELAENFVKNCQLL